MRKILLTSAATIALCVPAIAADMPVKAPPPVPVVSWTGCYIGGNTGGAWAHKDTTELTVNGAFVGNNAGSTTASGWAYGGQIGCDYQFNNNWVVGVRGMWDGSNMRGSSQWLTFPNDTKYKIDSFGTLVGKLGVLLNPTVQLYGLAGVAWVHDSLTFTNSPGVGNFATGDQTRTGYDVGVGLSWMFARNWDLWVEYDHMGFGTKNLDLTGIGAGTGDFFTARVKQSVDKVLVGIDYRFDWGKAPVVAKY